MNNDILVRIVPAHRNKLALIVEGTNLPQAGKKFPRPPWIPETNLINELRRGDAQETLVRKVTTAVSTWLLGNDLQTYLSTTLSGQGGGQLRLVFNVDEQLRPALADLPLELLQLERAIVPLVLYRQISAIVHLLEKVGAPQNSLSTHNWPLHVLIVRSNPIDLGGSVPEGATIRDAIKQQVNDLQLDPDLVQVDLLSSEVGKPATLDVFRAQLRTTSYDILVYLGHADLLPVNEGNPPSPVLLMETDDAKYHRLVSAAELAGILLNKPVPVVILAGCLTAADISALHPDMRKWVEESIPQWMRGCQGVAQALVNSEAGVQFAVGMSYRLEKNDAVWFLQAFFRSLLHDMPGNTEVAVRAGREELHAKHEIPPGWAAPRIFSTRAPEPMFDFLGKPPPGPIEAFEKRDQEIRNIFWSELVQKPLSKRLPGETDQIKRELTAIEKSLRGDLQMKGPLIMPALVEAPAGQTVPLPIELYGQLDLEVLSGKVVVSSESVTIQSVQEMQALKESGYQLFNRMDGNETTFRIERTPSNAGKPLPEGSLFEIRLTLGAVSPIIYSAHVKIQAVQPNKLIRSGDNAIIVPLP